MKIEALEGRKRFTTFEELKQAVRTSFRAIAEQATDAMLADPPSVYRIQPRTILARQENIDPMTLDTILYYLQRLGLVMKNPRYKPGFWRIQPNGKVSPTKLRQLYDEEQ